MQRGLGEGVAVVRGVFYGVDVGGHLPAQLFSERKAAQAAQIERDQGYQT